MDELKIENLEDEALLDEIDVKLVAENLEDIYFPDEKNRTLVPEKPYTEQAKAEPVTEVKKAEPVTEMKKAEPVTEMKKAAEDLDEEDEDVFDADEEEVTVGFLAFLVSVMRIACVLLMGAITATSIKTFWYGGKELGSLMKAVADKDMVYLTYVGAAVVINLILILWVIRILPKRKNGRLSWYDKGQGGFGFILVLLVTCAAWPAIMAIEILPWFDRFWWIASVKAVLEAINANHGFYLFCGICGTVLSFFRKNL